MKKLNSLYVALILVMMFSVSTAFADENDASVTDLPLDQGIIIDMSQDEPSIITDQGDDGAVANDGTELPLDQGNIGSGEIDTGSVIDTSTEVTTTETKEPAKTGAVEPLAQTGLDSIWNLYSALALLIVVCMLGLIIIRTKQNKVSN